MEIGIVLSAAGDRTLATYSVPFWVLIDPLYLTDGILFKCSAITQSWLLTAEHVGNQVEPSVYALPPSLHLSTQVSDKQNYSRRTSTCLMIWTQTKWVSRRCTDTFSCRKWHHSPQNREISKHLKKCLVFRSLLFSAQYCIATSSSCIFVKHDFLVSFIHTCTYIFIARPLPEV